jgi:hypothetical protein
MCVDERMLVFVCIVCDSHSHQIKQERVRTRDRFCVYYACDVCVTSHSEGGSHTQVCVRMRMCVLCVTLHCRRNQKEGMFSRKGAYVCAYVFAYEHTYTRTHAHTHIKCTSCVMYIYI